MRKYLLSLLSIFILNTGTIFTQDPFDDLLGINTNVPNPAVVKVVDIPVLHIALLDLDIFSPDVVTFGTLELQKSSLRLFNVLSLQSTNLFESLVTGTGIQGMSIQGMNVSISNITSKINQSKEAWMANINLQLFSNIKDWVDASKMYTISSKKIH